MSDRRERSAEEREAARRNREAKRAGRAGRPLPPEPLPPELLPPEPLPPEPEPPASEPLAPAHPEVVAEPVGPEAMTPKAIPAPRERAVPVPLPAPPRFAPAAGFSDEPQSVEPAQTTDEHRPDPELHEDDHLFDTDEHHQAELYEAPAGIKRVGAASAPAPAVGGSARGSRRRGRRIGALAAFLLVLGVILFSVLLWQPFHGQGTGVVTVVVPAHASTGAIGDQLEQQGVVASSFFFGLRVTLGGDRSKLLAGTYHLRRGETYGAVLTALTTPPPPVPTTDLTITEGRSRRQISELLKAQGFGGGYLAASVRSRLLRPAAYGAPRSTPSLEGFLFPSTYTLRKPLDLVALVDKQLAAFRRVFATVNLSYARSKHLSAYDTLIIASIVEKEAATAHDRPLVASVIYNRLHDRMPLGMDSTTRYEFNNYTKPLTVSELGTASPYNTRLHNGLPPTPIGNPGLAAIQAAAHPAPSGYLYFVVKPCGNGASAFSSSYAQFLQDSARYQSARAQRGGRSPTKC